MNKEEKATAYHEAGHALAAYRFDHFADRIHIVPKGDTLGGASTEEEDCTERSYIEQIVVLYAGLAAERKYDEDADKRGSSRDDERAAALLEALPNETEPNLRMKAKEIIDKDWNIIQSISEELFRCKTLEADEWQIIIDAFDEGEDWKECLSEMREVLSARLSARSQ